MPKKQKSAIEIISPRKKVVPRSAFKKGERTPHQFKPGVSGNPTGRAKNDLKLVTKSLREQLSTRAPNDVAKSLGLPVGASWAQCTAAALLRGAVSGDTQASRLLIEMTEGRAPQSLSLGGMDGEPLFGNPTDRPFIHVHFVESDGDGRLPADYIEGNIVDG